MRYTVAALASNDREIAIMRSNHLAVGAPQDAIAVRSGAPGTSQPHISVKTTDLEAAESYREMLELASGVLVSSNEKSSTHDAIR
ncbi:MAG TPA: hypothetical protein VHX44_04560 [Planctomycetota bacterium]|nr:hypothetical protein [Planctomycetota bacterium]